MAPLSMSSSAVLPFLRRLRALPGRCGCRAAGAGSGSVGPRGWVSVLLAAGANAASAVGNSPGASMTEALVAGHADAVVSCEALAAEDAVAGVPGGGTAAS